MSKSLNLKAALALSAFAFTTGAEASSIVSYADGSRSWDTTTGLLWLDLTHTINRSYLDVSANLGIGGDFAGYRYATAYEVLSLWEHAGIGGGTTLACGGPDCIFAERVPSSPVMDLVSLLGGDTWAPSFGFGGVIALSSTLSVACIGCGYTAYMTPELRVYYEYNNPQVFGLADALVVEGLRNDIADSSYASWLVSTDTIAPVPLPAALPLFAAGLGAIGFMGWRKKRGVGP